MTQLILIRGLPGSGKSMLAKKLSLVGYYHYETDMFMVDENGEYSFDPSRLSECHETCRSKVFHSLQKGRRVVVSNTFTKLWEMNPYLEMGFPYHVVTAMDQFENVHGVPAKTIERMSRRWEPFEGEEQYFAYYPKGN